jgi:hypothetical protein
MSAFTLAVIGGLLFAVGGVVLDRARNKLKTTEDVYALSVPPSIEISVRPRGDDIRNEQQELVITNTGPHELVDVKVTPVGYLLQKDPVKVVLRNSPGGAYPVAQLLEPYKEVRMHPNHITKWLPPLKDGTQTNAVAVVVVYRRKADNRRYVEVEPYTVSWPEMPAVDKTLTLAPMFAGKDGPLPGPMFIGDPALQLSVMKQMIEGERFFFNAK